MKQHQLARLITGLLFIFFLNTAGALAPDRAMSQYVHEKWGIAQGFPGGKVYAISQSADGYLWIGTEKGLVRFDGYKFTLVQQPIANISPLGPVRGLVSDADGNLWIRVDGPRLFRYHNREFEDAFNRYGLREPAFAAMSKDNEGHVLLATIGNSIIRFRDGAFTTLASALKAPASVISLAETRDQRIWLGTADDGLFCLENDERVSKIPNGVATGRINALFQAINGDLWIGTNSGVRLSNSEGRTSTLPALLGRLEILALTRDHDGNVWVGTNHGLIRITASGDVAFDQVKNNPAKEVTTVFEDRDGDLWFGGAQGIERLKNGMFTTYSATEGLPAGGIGSVYADKDGRIWLAPLSGGLFWVKDGKVGRVEVAGLDKDVVYSISGGQEKVWLGRQHGGLTVLSESNTSSNFRTYGEREKLAQNSVYSVHQNRDGTVWAGTVNAGISRLKDGIFTNYPPVNGAPANSVNSIVEGYDGTTWFATPTGLFSFADGHWVNRTAQDGLPSSSVQTIFEDSKHVLWIATSRGLAYLSSGLIGMPPKLPQHLHEQIFGIAEDELGFLWFETPGHAIRVNRDRLMVGSLDDSDVQSYGKADGLEGIEEVRRDRSLVVDPVGRIWVSLDRGVAMVDPRHAFSMSVPVSVRIESMSAGGIETQPESTPRIAPGSKTVTFDFAATSLSSLDRIRFRYKLDGSGQGWSDIVGSREVTFKKLGPGTYRFHVMASSGEGLWNGPDTTVSFLIEPVFWQTWWFRGISVALCALLILALYRLRIYSLTRQLKMRFQERLVERTRIAQELHDTLLQSFQGLMLRFQTVDEMLPTNAGDAKKVLEGALDRADQALNESRDAIQNIRSSTATDHDLVRAMNLLIAQLREEAGIENPNAPTFDLVIEGQARGIQPFLRDEISRFAKEALRNALLHAQAGRIETELTFSDRSLRLRFRDDGKGIESEILKEGGRAGHWGLVGMRERARHMRAELNVWTRPGAGTEVELTVPASIAFKTPCRIGRNRG